MRTLRVWFTVQRMLVGAACWAAVGFLLQYAVVRPPAADEPGVVVAFVGIMAILGTVAAGFLSTTGWAMLAGGIVGAIATGLFGVVATLHPKGLIYSFIGAPLAALFVLMYRREHEPAKASAKEGASPPTPGVWDRELDR